MQETIPNSIFVTGYGRNQIRDDRDIRDMFKEFGTILSIAYKGHFTFVTFQRDSEAEKAVKELNDRTFHGNKLKVEITENRRARKTGPSVSDECFKCKRRGHWARDCQNQEKSRSRSHRKRRGSRSKSRSRHRDRKRRRSYSKSSRSASYSSSRSRKRPHRRSHERDRRPRRRSSPHRRRHGRRSSSKSSRRTKSRSPSRPKKTSKSDHSLQRD